MNEYKELETDFTIPDELDDLIKEYVHFLNTGEGIADDYYTMEIALAIRDYSGRYRNDLTNEQASLLKRYYVRGGIKG